jgi:hypothetical protein
MRDSGLGKALALAAQLGFSIACPMLAFIAGGAWLDSKMGWSPWMLFLGILLGVLTAAGLFYQIAMIPTRKRNEPDADKAPYKMEQEGKVRDVGTPRADKWKRNGH